MQKCTFKRHISPGEILYTIQTSGTNIIFERQIMVIFLTLYFNVPLEIEVYTKRQGLPTFKIITLGK